MAHVGKIKVPVEIICSCDRERWQAMNVLLSEQLEEARRWHLAAVNEKLAAQADAERLFTALDGYIMARITGTDLCDYDDLAERAARAHRSLVAATPDPPDDDKRVRVTCFDPVTGESETQPLDPDNYILTLGERCEITACHVYANGTVQLTIKRGAA